MQAGAGFLVGIRFFSSIASHSQTIKLITANISLHFDQAQVAVDKSVVQVNIFHISSRKHMLLLLTGIAT